LEQDHRAGKRASLLLMMCGFVVVAGKGCRQGVIVNAEMLAIRCPADEVLANRIEIQL
jgi:hypothetical protein